MDLTVRPLEERDFPACVALLRGRLAYPRPLLSSLPRVWRRLLHDDALTGSVAEWWRPGEPPVVAGFGASVFVTDAWTADARSGREPYLTRRTIERELDGRSPILRPPAIARRNDNSGVRILILHYGEARELPPEVTQALRYRMFQAFVEEHRGYRVAEVVQEFWDEIEPEFVTGGWGRVLSDYAAFYGARGEPVPAAGHGPRLVGITREECLSIPGQMAAPIFVFTPPRLAFTRAEQRLLSGALPGRTDVELSRSLRLALPTIKSRWRAIYDRALGFVPELPSERLAPGRAHARGHEKRRLLLDYIRRHPEELRPALARRRRRPPN